MAEQGQQGTDADTQIKDASAGGEDADDQAAPLNDEDPAGSWYPHAGEEANQAEEEQ